MGWHRPLVGAHGSLAPYLETHINNTNQKSPHQAIFTQKVSRHIFVSFVQQKRHQDDE
jgi:hypothetical protein